MKKIIFIIFLITTSLCFGRWENLNSENGTKTVAYFFTGKSIFHMGKIDYEGVVYYLSGLYNIGELTGNNSTERGKDKLDIRITIDNLSTSKTADVINEETGVITFIFDTQNFEDIGIIEKMKKGKEMRFVITTLNGDVIIKKVNLLGFTKVFNNMNNQ